MKNNKLYFLNALIIYIIILVPSLYTPFQSDDYSYFLKGVSLDNTISHYMKWSGRLITDLTSSFLLKYLPSYLYKSINAFVFTLLCILISILPKYISRIEITTIKLSSVTLWMVFLAYWISNPNLGQTSFWLVGSANYLWPIMWASAYFVLILYFLNIKNNIKKTDYLCLVILGFLAGCSNENTSVSIVLFTCILFFIEKNKQILSIGLISSFIGTLILILAPGNSIRKLHFKEWYSNSTIEQLYSHIFDRMPDAISIYLQIYLLIIAALIILILIRENINKKSILYVGLFFILSLFSNLVLAKSPYIGGRNLNTGLFFLLPVLSIIIYEFQNVKGIFVKLSNSILIGYSLLFFIPSYLYFTFMMSQTKVQHEIRENIINAAKVNNKNVATIPEWYFTKLLKNDDKFDTYKSNSMPEYYGIDSIIYSPVNFNYGGLVESNKYPIDKLIKDDLKILNIYNYPTDIKNIFNNNGLTLEFNKSIKNYLQEDNKNIYIQIFDKNGKIVNSNIPIDKEVKISDKFYINTDLKNFKMSEILKFELIIYKSNTNDKSKKIKIYFNQSK